MPAGGDPQTRLDEMSAQGSSVPGILRSNRRSPSLFAEDRHFVFFYSHCARVPGPDWLDRLLLEPVYNRSRGRVDSAMPT